MIFNLIVRITKNNIIISINNSLNKTICCLSGGTLAPKLKGGKKITKVAVEGITDEVIKKLKLKKCTELNVYFFGNDRQRKIVIKKIFRSKIKINTILDLTPTPHNGCRLKKKKR